MDKGPQKSIFDVASDNRSKNKKNLPSTHPEKNLPSEPPLAAPSVEPEHKLSNTEIQSTMTKMKKMTEELQEKLNDLYVKSGVSREDLEKFLNDPKNFSKGRWAIVQENIKELESKLWSVVGEEQKKKKVVKEKDKQLKERKGKVLGSRKNWLPMR